MPNSVDEPDCHITYDVRERLLLLWLPPIDPKKVVWVGRGSDAGEALEMYDMDGANYSNMLSVYLNSWIERSKGDIHILHPSQQPRLESNPPLPETTRYNYRKLQSAMDFCRAFKDSHEVQLIKQANAISTEAHTAVLRKLRHFKNEAQVEALYLDVCVSRGAKHQAYPIIAGSGQNAAILHYISNNEDFADRQLMCLDAGAEWKCYASDVTRTFPLSGDWPSVEARNIYELVQRMQTSALEMIGPGDYLLVAHIRAHEIAVEGLLELGILHNGTVKEIMRAGTSFAFYPHGLGHHMGLEVHDVASSAIAVDMCEMADAVLAVCLEELCKGRL